MPTYGYECKSCKHSFDIFQSMKDEPLKTCPKCGKELRRLINGGSGIIFRGSGFYITDKCSGSSKSAAVIDSKPKDSAESTASQGSHVDGREKADCAKAGADAKAGSDSSTKADGPKADSAKPDSQKASSQRANSSRADSSRADSHPKAANG